MQRSKPNQNSSIVPERPGQQDNRNWFDGHSHPWVATFTMGKIVPFLFLETMPNDYWKLNAEVMLRFAPLYLPMMHRVNLALEYFYVPYRIIWNNKDVDENTGRWEDFIMHKVDSYTVPKIQYTAIDYTYGSGGELPMYMGVPTIIEDTVGLTPEIEIAAMPLAGYYMIYDQWYRNDQIQQPIQAEEFVRSATIGLTTFVNPPADSLSCCYRNWQRDLFTSMTFEPQQGTAVQIPMYDLDYQTSGGTEVPGPFRWRKLSDNTAAPDGGVSISGASWPTNTPGATVSGASSLPLYLDIQETAADIAAFRFASIYQEFLERVTRTGDKITDYYPTFWHTDPYKGTLQVPEFLGSKKGRVVVSEVMSTAETATLKVGNYAGQALALESTNTIEYHCLEHGVIIGNISVYPDTVYFQGLSREWTRETWLDFPDPRFALIGDEEIKNKEVQYRFQTALLDTNDEIFGYRERLLDGRFKNGTVAGYMRTILNSFHLGRLFNPTDPENLTNGSVLNSEFLQCKPRITDVFQVVDGEDEIYAYIYNDIKVQRMLPKYGIPQL